MDYGIDPVEAPVQVPDEAPAQPGLATAQPAPQASQPASAASPEQSMVSNALSFWRDPERIKLVGMAAAMSNRTDVLQWLKMGHEAEKENAIEAVGALTVGDKARALQLFNASGQMKARSIDDAGNGMYKVSFEDGTDRTFNPKQEFVRFLAPPQMTAHLDRVDAQKDRRQAQVERAEMNRQTLLQRREIEHDKMNRAAEDRDSRERIAEENRNANAPVREAVVALKNAQVSKLENGSDPVSTHQTEQARRQSVNRVDRIVRDLVKTDPNTKEKSGPDEADRLRIKSIAVSYINKKGMDAEEAVSEAQDLVMGTREKAKATVDKEVEDRKKAARGLIWNDTPDWAGSKSEGEYRAKRTDELVKYGLREVMGEDKPKTTEQGKTPPKPPATREAQRSTRNPGAQPSTAPDNPPPLATTNKPGQSPSAAPAKAAPYKEGDVIRKKGTDQKFIVKNGVPVPM